MYHDSSAHLIVTVLAAMHESYKVLWDHVIGDLPTWGSKKFLGKLNFQLTSEA